MSKKDFPPLSKNAQQQRVAKPSSVHYKLLKEAVAQRSQATEVTPTLRQLDPPLLVKGASRDYRASWSHPVPLRSVSKSVRAWPWSPPCSQVLHGGLPHLKAALDNSGRISAPGALHTFPLQRDNRPQRRILR
ncbi:Hypothetical predicted protein [Xyrichtys novacula]|uniref:Uncharacterized protein n=1 Tax=Xyrichtys novacula TaxID=13765 RepID=A0AAV1FYW4_XYRNO|nr:Hypothetical predicted protein [Xyrichtys novacula]